MNDGHLLHVDEKLARGLALQELRRALKDKSPFDDFLITDIRHPVGAALKPILYRYHNGRRPDDAYISGVMQKVDEEFASRPGIVTSRSRDADGEHVRSYVHVAAVGTEKHPSAHVRYVMIEVQPEIIIIRDSRLIEVSGHALERFHLRTRQGLRRNILRDLAGATLGRLSLLSFLADAASEHGESRIALPLGDGLALATFREPEGTDLNHSLIKLMNEGNIKDVDALKFTFRTRKNVRIATFIGPDEMQPNQDRLREMLVDFEERHADELAHLSQVSASPMSVVFMMAKGLVTKDDHARHDSESSARAKRQLAMNNEIMEMFAVEDFRYAMGHRTRHRQDAPLKTGLTGIPFRHPGDAVPPPGRGADMRPGEQDSGSKPPRSSADAPPIALPKPGEEPLTSSSLSVAALSSPPPRPERPARTRYARMMRPDRKKPAATALPAKFHAAVNAMGETKAVGPGILDKLTPRSEEPPATCISLSPRP